MRIHTNCEPPGDPMIECDEFTAYKEYGWVHLEDGEGSTRLTMPRGVWMSLCEETLKKWA